MVSRKSDDTLEVTTLPVFTFETYSNLGMVITNIIG